MTFEPSTGRLTTDAGDSVGPDLTRAAFLVSSIGRDAAVLVVNEPRASWSLARSIGGRPFRMGLYFDHERLDMVILALDEPAFGTSWESWSRVGELARKAAHEMWLAVLDPSTGEGRDFDWGFVSSIYDDKSGGSEIVIRYGARLPEAAPASPYPSIEFGRVSRG
jgi:hypothetical protein